MTLLIKNKSNLMANHVGSASAMSDLSSTTFCASVINKEMCWIPDTRATDHMVYLADLLTTKSCVTNQNMHLSNRAIATITHIGSIHFANFILNDVLCVPSFKLNLISISKLVHNSHYLTTFTNNTCIQQDQRSGKMIGMGTERGGL